MRASFFPTAILLACFLHGVVAFILVKLLPDLTPPEEKIIPVVLVSTQEASSSSNNNPRQVKSPDKNLLSTIEKSKRTTQKRSKQKQTQVPSRTTPPKKIPSLPTFSQPNLEQHKRTNTSTKGLQNLFGQNQNSALTQPEQISEKKLPHLSDYELSLLQRLSREELYTAYHKVLASYQRSKIDFSIEITLFSNGAIKKAKIHQSSQIPQIDELAIRTAYNASPYDKPPTEDIDKGFKYVIPISYQK